MPALVSYLSIVLTHFLVLRHLNCKLIKWWRGEETWDKIHVVLPGGSTKETSLVGRAMPGAGQLLGYVPRMTSLWPSTLALWEGTLASDFTETVERGQASCGSVEMRRR